MTSHKFNCTVVELTENEVKGSQESSMETNLKTTMKTKLAYRFAAFKLFVLTAHQRPANT